MKKLFVMLSGRGSNFLKIYENIKNGYLKAEICGVFSNKKDAKGIEKAKEFGLKTFVLESKGFPSRRAHEEEVEKIIDSLSPDFIVLAGYMRILSEEFVRKYKWKIVNIHPALLPSFPGVEAQRQALEYGVKFSGCTVHFVDEGVDSGPIILQRVVPVFDSDTVEELEERILAQEHIAYSEALKLLIEREWKIEGRRFILI
ncbi:MAG: phosphoribosylglycinamide formyltransferase [Thermoanaerobaculia bacterium]